ncbi:YciI family protein [Planctomonas psychrotolerans]|uniref:YciI family protein n=1 Tax=Planctomonas psychrotolerans TaxID=2528712 RepID=UPI00123A2CFF|nr:YciI family protein [Planctomonas psychrotolerans]
MQYMMFVCTDSTAPAYDPAQDNIEEWAKEVYDGGVGVHGDRLRPAEDATTVKVRDGELRVSAGPFAETTEWIAGYDVIECADLDEAIEIASRHPMAKFGQIEIRPAWPLG